MKKVQIAVFKEDFDKVIKSLQRFELMMIINKEGGDASVSLDLNEALQQRVTKTLALVKKYEEKKPSKVLYSDSGLDSADCFHR